MKDFISKVTFGFLMAQLLPGAVVVFAITCASMSNTYGTEKSFQQITTNVGSAWFEDSFKTVSFLLISIGVGMFIHGLNWSVLAWLEWIQRKKGWKSLRGDLYWHKLPILLQLIISPFVMIIEIIWLLTAKKLYHLIMYENAPRIDSGKFSQFIFLQEFYLHFGQFYSHMAYAFLITTICILTCCIRSFGADRLVICVLFYLLTSMFFLLGRIQLGSLFKAEEELVKDCERSEKRR